MKKKIKIFIVLIFLTNLLSFQAHSHGIEFTPIAGYTFGDEFNLYGGGYGYVGDGFTWGAILSKNINPNYAIEFLYSRQETTGEFSAYDYYTGVSISDYNIPMTVSYFQIGGCRLAPLGTSGKVEGFGGLNLGIVLFTPKDQKYNYDEEVRFATEFKLGAKIWMSDKVGLRLQANHLLIQPTQPAEKYQRLISSDQ